MTPTKTLRPPSYIPNAQSLNLQQVPFPKILIYSIENFHTPGKFLSEYLILQGCSQFVLSIKIQNSSISQAKIHISNGAPNFASVPPLSTEQLFFSAEVLLLRTPQIPREDCTL